MFAFALPLVLTCTQANILMARVYAKNYPSNIEQELFHEIRDLSPEKCEWRIWHKYKR